MLFSETVRYALLALAYLAQKEKKLIKVNEISERQNVPKAFLSKIFHTLAKKKILHSYKGPMGGFSLREDPKKISLYQVVEALGEEDTYQRCIIRPGSCEEYEDPCPIHTKWEPVKESILNFLHKVSIQDLVEVEKRTFEKS